MVKKNIKYSKTIRNWLLIGLIMLVGQVILGGITRLTGSGLSITRWDILTGVIPPLNGEEWIEAFEMYKETPQFQKLNSTFTVKEFKFIYFWEYFHRLWVRSLGFIFLIPFLFFVFKKRIDFFLIKRLGIVVLLTMLTASAGWIMVQSGLVNKPWVNAYKLTIHFILAVLVITAMVRTIADVYILGIEKNGALNKITQFLLGITFIQMIFAGLMAGMRSGLYFPTWPSMNGDMIPDVILHTANWSWENMMNYDSHLFAPAFIQFSHRMIAYLLLGLTIYMYYRLRGKVTKKTKQLLNIPVILILLQMVLGILTVINVNGKIPLFLGVSHQLVGLLYYMSLLFLYYSLRKIKA